MLAEVLPEYRQLKEALRDFNGAWLDSLNGRTFAPLWALLRAVEAEYDALKQDRGVMDFDDLTLAATRLLKNTGEFAESRFRLEARYHHLLLDEFQDTSDPQWDLLRAIAKPWTEGEGLAAEEVRRVTNEGSGNPPSSWSGTTSSPSTGSATPAWNSCGAPPPGFAAGSRPGPIPESRSAGTSAPPRRSAPS